MAFGIFQPFSPLEFIGGLLYVFGLLFALVGGIMALSKRRRGARPGKTGLWVRKAALGLIGVLAGVSVAGFFMTRTTVSAEAAAGLPTVDMVEFEFVPGTPTVATGQNLLLTNSDGFVHDFTIDEFDIYLNFVPGSEAIVDLSDVPAGTYQFYCSLHSDGTTGMAGTITIEAQQQGGRRPGKGTSSQSISCPEVGAVCRDVPSLLFCQATVWTSPGASRRFLVRNAGSIAP